MDAETNTIITPGAKTTLANPGLNSEFIKLQG